MRPVVVGLIGCGNISAAYLRAAPLFPQLRIKLLADADLSRAEARATEFGLQAAGTPNTLYFSRLGAKLRAPSPGVVLPPVPRRRMPRAFPPVILRAIWKASRRSMPMPPNSSGPPSTAARQRRKPRCCQVSRMAFRACASSPPPWLERCKRSLDQTR
jgi:hypothetical protein